MNDINKLEPVRECYYMIWFRNKKNGRKCFHRNTIGAQCIFRGYENAMVVFNSLLRLHPEVHLVKYYDDDPEDKEIMVREVISYDEE